MPDRSSQLGALQAFGILRVAASVVLLFRALMEYPNLAALYGSRGIVPWTVSDYAVDPWMPRLSWLASHLPLRPDYITYLVYDTYIFALVALAIGLFPRAISAICFVLYLFLSDSSAASSYGFDIFARMALFYTVIAPSGFAYSVVGYARTIPWNSLQVLLALPALWALRVQVAVVYLSAGLEKAKGTQWWNGEAIWRALMMPTSLGAHQQAWAWLAYHPFVPTALGIATLILETGYAIFIWPRRSRPVWLCGIVSMHLGIAIFLQLWAFAAIMITLNIAAFGSEYVSRGTSSLGVLVGYVTRRPLGKAFGQARSSQNESLGV